ncbi:hypothetical protein L1887_62314 [Cichorium endivia]|nr:hypothetical protein L1887_62314 [Cichorium endivia]
MSPAAQSMPSPANWPNSPMYRPSPRPAQSPAAQQHNTGGNSLSQQNGPGSVGSSNVHTMRVSPARNLSPAAFPTILTQAGFEAMCRSNAPNENPSFEGNATFAQLSHLERFLGCVFMHKNLRQFIIKPDCPLTLIQTTELGAIQFKDKNELFHFKIQMHPDTMQNLQIKITSLDRSHNISQDEIETVERFFELKVISEPFKPDAFMTFARILNVPLKFVKDFIQLMRLELYPDRGFKWALNWCLTISPGTMMRTPGPSIAFWHVRIRKSGHPVPPFGGVFPAADPAFPGCPADPGRPAAGLPDHLGQQDQFVEHTGQGSNDGGHADYQHDQPDSAGGAQSRRISDLTRQFGRCSAAIWYQPVPPL